MSQYRAQLRRDHHPFHAWQSNFPPQKLAPLLRSSVPPPSPLRVSATDALNKSFQRANDERPGRRVWSEHLEMPRLGRIHYLDQ